MGDLIVYKLYAGATGDGAATLDITFDGQIVAVQLELSCTGADVLNDNVTAEVSFSSTSALGTNDTRASIIGGKSTLGAITTGGANMGRSISVSFGSDGIPVAAGERLYLHVAIGGTVSPTVSAWVYVRVTGGMGRADRRRI